MVLRSNTYWWAPWGLSPARCSGKVGGAGCDGVSRWKGQIGLREGCSGSESERMTLRVKEVIQEGWGSTLSRQRRHASRLNGGGHRRTPEASGAFRGASRLWVSGVSPQGKLKARSWCTSFSSEFSNSSLIPVGRPKETRDQNHHGPAGERPSFRKTPSLMRHRPVFPLN